MIAGSRQVQILSRQSRIFIHYIAKVEGANVDDLVEVWEQTEVNYLS